MAKINYSSYSKQADSVGEVAKSKTEWKVNFFNCLKEDGDEVIVRFPYKSSDEFDLASVHSIKYNNIWRKVACLKEEGKENICPFCKTEKATVRFFAKFLVYSKTEDQTVVAKSYVWDRPTGFADSIISALNDAIELGLYPVGTAIEDVVFKIKRSGKHGDIKTTYKVSPANPQIYASNLYVKAFQDLLEYKPEGKAYMTKTADEINAFLKSGQFPQRVYNKPETVAVVTKPVSVKPVSAPVVSAPAVAPTPASSVVPTASQTVAPTDTPTTTADKPHRRYSF